MMDNSPLSMQVAHVVTVKLKVLAEHVGKFRSAILQNASTSLELEPGCLIFDVCEDPDSPVFFLYEIYASAEAFAEHLASEHFKAFDVQSLPWVAEKQVMQFKRLLPDALPVPARGLT